MRKIDADAAIDRMKETYCKGCDNDYGCRCEACWVDDAIGEIEEAPTLRDWIPCSERMPENLARVLFAFHGSNVRSGFRNCGFGSRNAWYSEGFHYDDNEITHWMPLPEPPQRKDDTK